MSLKEGDAAAAAVQKTPNRITLADLEALVAAEYYLNGATIAGAPFLKVTDASPLSSLPALTVCVIVTKHGFTLVGKSAPADPLNFDAELGRRFAREDALKQLWPLEGYRLRRDLHLAAAGEAASLEAS